MKNIKAVLGEILDDIRPEESYEKEIFERLNSIIKKINRGRKSIKAILGGSGAKGTWLKTFDADIFVLFDYKKFKDKSSKLSDTLEKILKKNFRNVSRLHGSRDYFQIKDNNFTFEIIPILKINKAEQAKNITDVSPLHSNWVRKHKKLINEMKLAKQFCQAQNVYGAESYIRGFSGYVCEILAVYYGSFQNLAKNAAKWREKTVIDVQRYYKGKDIFKIVNTSKLVSPLIVIDPVQKDRNAAAALSIEKFDDFKKASVQFLKNPSKEFFAKKDMKLLFLQEKAGGKLIVVSAKPLAGKADVAGSKLFKVYELIHNRLLSNDFKMLKAGWEWDRKNDAAFYFLLDRKPLPASAEIEGPPLKLSQHAANFKKIHKKSYMKNGKLYATIKRKFTLPENLVKDMSKSQYVRQKCMSIKIDVL
ncbi:nucleotidyltransferase domain-containing protein [Candidatus Woesearchaeota archaeon]|nr:nucleotidyltransferase domain-containing protein [Candidatus Woesearchaeota archaeon]